LRRTRLGSGPEVEGDGALMQRGSDCVERPALAQDNKPR